MATKVVRPTVNGKLTDPRHECSMASRNMRPMSGISSSGEKDPLTRSMPRIAVATATAWRIAA